MCAVILISGCLQDEKDDCPKIFDPVCGKDGQTYPNPCIAEEKGVEVDYEGECKEKSTPLKKCGDGVCSEIERRRNLCPEDCEEEEPNKQSCNELGGIICSSKETCTGSWLGASDTDICCSGDCKTPSGEISLNLLKKIEIPNGARPEIVATEDRVFVVYRNNEESSYDVKIYNKDMETEITSKTLVRKTNDYGMPTDMRIASDGEYLYVFYESIIDKKAYLLGAKYRLDDDFEKVKSTGVITSDKHYTLLQPGDEQLDDPISLVGKDYIFAITRYKSSYKEEAETIYKVYKFTKGLSKIDEFDLDLSSVANGNPRQASIIYHNGYFYMVLPTTVGQGEASLSTPADIVRVKLDINWNVIESKTISSDPDYDVETYVTGFKADENHFYMTYNQAELPLGSGFNTPLRIFDKDFNLIKTENIISEHTRPHIEVTDDRIFADVSYGRPEREDKIEIYVYQIVYE